MILKKDVTGTEVFAFIREQLGRSISLSDSISKLPLEEGRVFAFVPEEALEKDIFDFQHGGIYPFDYELRKTSNLIPIKNESRPLVLDMIMNHIKKNGDSCCLFESPTDRPNDPWLINSGISYSHIDDTEMFYFFNIENCDAVSVKDAFSSSDSYVFMCALGFLTESEHSKFEAGRQITCTILDEYVKNMISFFVKAYDGEGFLVWER